jgi:hypothetical protein
VAGGKLSKLRRGRGVEDQPTAALPAIDKELLAKPISTLLRELHDEAMNFKEVSLSKGF